MDARAGGAERPRRACARCGERRPDADFERARIGAHTDGGMRSWCNDCYRDPYRAERGGAEMRRAGEIPVVPPREGRP